MFQFFSFRSFLFECQEGKYYSTVYKTSVASEILHIFFPQTLLSFVSLAYKLTFSRYFL